VLRFRTLAVLFGGAYLPLAYTPFFIPGMTAGRGWIALALVVFASWRPGHLVAGAWLFGAVTILQLHAQALSLPVPPQFMSALPCRGADRDLAPAWRQRIGSAGLAGAGVRAGPLTKSAGAAAGTIISADTESSTRHPAVVRASILDG
jgi:hypothetical protein